MNQRQFSIIGFCHDFFCKRKASAKKKKDFREVSAKKILEELIGKRNKQREREDEGVKDFSLSTPNLVYCQVNGNFTMKPTISIKRKNVRNPKVCKMPPERSISISQGMNDQVLPRRNRERFRTASSLDYQPKYYTNVYRKLSLKTSKTKSRQKSFKKKNNSVSENFNSANMKSSNSCPNLNHITLGDHLGGFENILFGEVDNIDDFTTNLFLEDVLSDENDLDLVSINFDMQ